MTDHTPGLGGSADCSFNPEVNCTGDPPVRQQSGSGDTAEKITNNCGQDKRAEKNIRKKSIVNRQLSYPDFFSEEKRLTSFTEHGWPHKRIYPAALKRCGFYFTGVGDHVRCFHCGIGLRVWRDDDRPFQEHVLWSPKCKFLYNEFGQEPIEEIRAKFTECAVSQASRNPMDTIYPKCWLNDKIIDMAQEMVKKCFPNIGGLQSCLLGRKPDFTTANREFIQIVNTDYDNGGQHWVVLSTVGVKYKGVINLYDSSPSGINETVGRCIAKLLKSETDFIVVNCANCDIQKVDGNDCGPYAIATSFALANGLNPTEMEYKNKKHGLRRHLRQCIRSEKCKPFPYRVVFRKRENNCFQRILVQCICRMPNTKRGMVKCQKCSRLFHSECVSYTADDYICQNCHRQQLGDYNDIICLRETLDDTIIDKAQTIVKECCPYIEGLQSCVLGQLYLPNFTTVNGEYIQIVNIDGGQHWVILSTVGVRQGGVINLYDLSPSGVDESVKRCIANLLQCENDSVEVNCMNCDVKEVNDSGLHAIGTLFAVANGLDPTKMKFKNRHVLSHHLHRCISSRKCTPVPYLTRNNTMETFKLVFSSQTNSLHFQDDKQGHV